MNERREEMQPDSRTELPPDWDKVCIWDGKLSVQFGYAADGWVLMGLLATAYNQSLVLHLSNCYDPFPGMVAWLDEIAEGKLPATLSINEEGVEKELIVSAHTGAYAKYSDIEFRVIGTFWDEKERKEVWRRCFLMRVRREQLLREFTGRLERWLAEDYDVDAWHMTAREDYPDETWWDLRRLDIASVKAKIQGGAS